MSINLKIYERSSKQITFEDFLEDNFINDSELEKRLENLDIESNKTNYDKYSGLLYNSANFIPWWGYANNDYEYESNREKYNNFDNTAWDFNKKMFLYGIKNIGNMSFDILSFTSDKIKKIVHDSDFDISYIKDLTDVIKYKEDLMTLIEKKALSRMFMREQKKSQLDELNLEYKNHIINTKDDFLEILPVKN